MRTMPAVALLAAGLLAADGSVAQDRAVLHDFYRLEQQTWAEAVRTASTADGQSNIDVTFYHLGVDLAISSPWLQGSLLCRFRSVAESTQTVKLTLRREFAVDSVTGDAGWFGMILDTLLIRLNRPLTTGESGAVRVYYRGVPPVAGGLKGLRYVTHATNQRVIVSLSTPFLSHYWWPCKEGPGDKPDSVWVDITIPDTSIAGFPVIAVSNGLLSGVETAGGKRTFRWRERHPIVPFYVMAAVSNYRDFHQTFTGTHGEQFPMDYYVFNEHLTAAQQGVADLPQVMAAFSDRFGVYPFADEKYGMTQLGFYGAIENQTNTIINNMGISYFGVAVHELAHMWFGDMITCRDWHHGWLNEGFATYAEALWAEHTGGRSAYLSYVQNFQFWAGGTLYLQAISDPFAIFVPIIYDKGAYVLHMLRGVLGDSLFFASLSAYAADPAFRYGHATTEDFRDLCATVSGRNLDFFFDEWVYDQYYPSYEYTWNVAAGNVNVGLRQTQSALGRRAVFTMPVRLKFFFEGGGDTTVTVWNDQQIQSFTIPLSRQVWSMQFDPENWILRSATPAEVAGSDEGIPAITRLEQNYPNPFNPLTRLRYTIARRGNVLLDVWNMLGERVATLVQGVQAAGTYEATFEGGHLPAGVYLARLSAVGRVEVTKMLLVK